MHYPNTKCNQFGYILCLGSSPLLVPLGAQNWPCFLSLPHLLCLSNPSPMFFVFWLLPLILQILLKIFLKHYFKKIKNVKEFGWVVFVVSDVERTCREAANRWERTKYGNKRGTDACMWPIRSQSQTRPRPVYRYSHPTVNWCEAQSKPVTIYMIIKSIQTINISCQLYVHNFLGWKFMKKAKISENQLGPSGTSRDIPNLVYPPCQICDTDVTS